MSTAARSARPDAEPQAETVDRRERHATHGDPNGRKQLAHFAGAENDGQRLWLANAQEIKDVPIEARPGRAVGAADRHAR
jgi:hypothetical protein